MPSEFYYRPIKALCQDGKVRTVRVKAYRYDGSLAADTAFSVPAHCRVAGRYVAGYVTGDEQGPGHAFRVMDTHRHLMFPYERRLQLLEDAGFDKCYVDGGKIHVGCSQCQALVISGMETHETGCPNHRRVMEDEGWVD